jgi:hypothetical protein
MQPMFPLGDLKPERCTTEAGFEGAVTVKLPETLALELDVEVSELGGVVDEDEDEDGVDDVTTTVVVELPHPASTAAMTTAALSPRGLTRASLSAPHRDRDSSAPRWPDPAVG